MARAASVLRVLQVLGINSVPAFGYLGAGWSPSTALALYWIEGVLTSMLVGIRIALHRRATRKRGHWRGLADGSRPAPQGTLLSSFVSVALPFSLVHGIFLALILFLVIPGIDGGATYAPALDDLSLGTIGVTGLLLLGFVFDLVGLRRRSFAWIEHLAKHALGRVVLVHLMIIFGMFAIAITEAPRGFFTVFIVLKTSSDLAWMLPQGKVSKEPPAWISWLGRLGPNKDGETFDDYWKRTVTEEEKLSQENEEVLG